MIAQEQDGSTDRTGLAESVRTVRRRWRLVATIFLITVAAALVYSLTATPIYLTSADVLIEPSGADVVAGTGTKISADEVATQTQVATSLPVAKLVREQLGLSETPDLAELVSVQPIGTSRILRISAQDASPTQAAETANAVATAYLQFRDTEAVNRYQETSQRLTQEQTDLQDQLAKIDKALKANPGRASLLQERRNVLTSLAQVATQLDALTESLSTASGGGELMRSAAPDTDPIAPQTELNLILGGLAGLGLGIGAALLRARFDDGVHDEEDVRQALNAVVLGRVPQWSERSSRDRLVTLVDPHAPASEEYQRLGVNVRFMVSTSSPDSGALILLTSARESEGKTVTSCNLAIAMARLGQRVVLVDADFRRAMMASRFGLGDPPGLSDLLVADGSIDSYLIDVGIDRLSLLPAGTLPPNPAALLSSARLQRVLRDLAAVADIVIIDSPPVLAGADTLELARHADMVLVVARERVSHVRQLTAVRDALRQLSVHTVGSVFNSSSDPGRVNYTYTRRERTISEAPGSAAAASAGPPDGAAEPAVAGDEPPAEIDDEPIASDEPPANADADAEPIASDEPPAET